MNFEIWIGSLLTLVVLVAAGALILRGRRERQQAALRVGPRNPGSLLHQTAELTREKVRLELDLEAHKRIEEALRQSEEKYRLLVENANDVIVIAQDGVMKFANPKTENMLGYSGSELRAMPFLEIIAPADREMVIDRYRRRINGEDVPSRYVFRAQDRGGRLLWVEINSVIIPWEGRPGTLCFLRDVTDRIRQENEVREATRAAQAANEAKSRFLANMSHEIRTPMNGIIGMTELALATPLSHQQRRYLRSVLESAEFMLSLINTILDFSKIEAGKLDLDPVPFKLHDQLGDTVKTLSLRASEKNLELVCHVHNDVPEQLIGDSGRLRQIIFNLVGNAIKFTERGEVVLNVECVERADQDVTLQFVVRDTGIGIPAEKQQMIFEPFRQADESTTRAYGGTGLGLAICAQLVELMGGRISVESQSGVGSQFCFTAKFRVAATAEPESLPSADVLPRDLGVLVVDDHAATRAALEDSLRSWGLRPTCVGSLAAAHAALRAAAAEGQTFALAIVDDRLEDGDGLSLVTHLQANLPATQVLYMISTLDPRGEATLRNTAGPMAHVTKPIMPSDLLEAIVEALAPHPGLDADAPGTAALDFGKTAHPLRILLAEDNLINRRVALNLLEGRGHDVVPVVDGQAALERLDREQFDLVLMDLEMPILGGLEATTLIRQREATTGAHLPIVAMTAHAMAGDRQRCLNAGMDDHVAKPIRAHDLFEAVERFTPRAVRRPGGDRGEGKSGADRPTADQAVATLAAVDESAQVPRAHSDAAGHPAFDRRAALAAVGGDAKLLRELVEIFLHDHPTWIVDLRRGLDQDDAKQVARVAHSLKNALGYFGAQETHDLAIQLEHAGRDAKLQRARELYPSLVECLTRLESELRALTQET